MPTPLSRAFPVFAAFATAAAVHAQTTIYVDASAPPSGNGQSWNTAFKDLQDAMDLGAQRAPAEIRVAQGIYTPGRGSLNRDSVFSIGSAVTILGGFAGRTNANPNQRDTDLFVSVLSADLAHDDAQGASRVFNNSRRILRGNVTTHSILDGLTMTSAFSDQRPAQPYTDAIISAPVGCPGCRLGLTLRNCKVVNNIGTNGQSIIASSELAIENSLIADNQMYGSSTAMIAAEYLRVVNSRILANRVEGAPVILVGISPSTSLVHLIANSVVSSNSGIAIVLGSATQLDVQNCTIVDNAAYAGTAIRIPSLVRARVRLINTIVYGNRDINNGQNLRQIEVLEPLAFVDFYTSNNFIPIGSIFSPSDPFAVLPPTLHDFTPGLRNSAGPDGDPFTWRDNDYRLSNVSQCVDAGDTRYLPFSINDITGAPPFDVSSRIGPSRGPISFKDIGAYELTVCTGDFDASGQATVQDVFSFIAAWFSSSPSADWNSDSQVNLQDLFGFLTAWFQGCP